MPVWGKGVGVTFGWLAGGPWGALLGLMLGNSADAGFGPPRRFSGWRAGASPAGWFPALFALLGHVARADGRVSESDVAFAEALMARMRLEPRQRRVAIRSYNDGRRVHFTPEPALVRLRLAASGRDSLAEGFLAVLVAGATVDGRPPPPVYRLLLHAALALGAGREVLAALLQSRGYPPDAPDSDPYLVLGIEERATDSEVKVAYRRLIQRHHPDRLGPGAKEAELREAGRRSAEIRRAWEQLRRRRGIR